MKPITVPSVPLPVPIDPRIRRRRIEVRRVEGRRRLRFVVIALSAFGLSASGWLASRSPLLDVDTVDVVGAGQASAEEVRTAGGLRPGLPMLDIDEAAVAARVESVPWVAEARVERHWPGRVRISITEREALAAAPDGHEWWLLDGTGRVLERVAAPPPGLVVVEGLSAAPAPGARVEGGADVLAVVRALTPSLRRMVTAVTVVGGGQLQLKLNPEGTVRLGPAADIQAKLAATETVLAQVDVTGLELLDVRLPSSPVLTRAGGRERVSTLSAG